MAEPHAPARPKLVRSHLRDLTAEEIRRLILSGEATPGTVLRLDDLAAHVGTSVTPVREALLLLVQEGWVTQEPHRGFRVASIRRKDIEDLYDLHAFLFGALARRAAVEISDELLGRLRRLDDELRTATEPRRAEELNHAFHEAVNGAADSPRLSAFARVARFLPGGFGWASVPGWLEHARGGHGALLAALEQRDAPAASAAMEREIRQAGRLLIDHLEDRGRFRPPAG